MRFLATLLVLAGIVIAGGGVYLFTGMGIMAAGMYLHDKAPPSRGNPGEMFIAVVLLLGALGAAATVLHGLTGWP